MKKITSILNLLAVSVALFAGVSPANAAPALRGFSPIDATMVNPGGAVVTIKGLPAWFQGIDGLAIKPCLDIARCVLVGAPDFNAALPLSYPTNFPSEAFYFDATNANIPVGTANALVVMALEYTFVDALGNLVPASTPGAVGNPFQRLRLTHTFIGGGGNLATLGITAGNFTVVTPWGTAVFPLSLAKCVNQGGDTKCTMTRDQPAGGPNPTAALGDPVLAPGSISTFLMDPTAPLGFLGTGAAVLSFTGAPAGGLNQITVTDPLGNSGTTGQLSVLIGQTIGLDVVPHVGADFGIWKLTAPSTPVTFTVTNLTGVAIPAAGLILTPSTPEFSIPAVTNTCAAGLTVLPPGNTCTFGVVFTPIADVASTGSITLASAGIPSHTIPGFTGTGDGIAPTVTVNPLFTNSLTPTITGTVFDANPGATVQVTVGGTPSAGLVTITPPAVAGAASTWSKVITLPIANAPNAISVTATDAAQTGGNISAPQTTTITHDNIIPVIAPVVTPSATTPNGIFTNTAVPIMTTNVTEINPAGGTIMVDAGLLPATTVPATQVLGPLADGPHTVKIVVNDSAGNSGNATIGFTVDTIAPVITLASPVVTAAGTIGVTAPVLNFPIADVNIDPAKTVVTFDGAVIPAVSGTTALPALVVGAPHTLTIAATDFAGNVAPVQTATFSLLLTDGSMTTLGATPPTIADVILALKVALNTPIVTFPEVANITPATDTFKHGDVASLDATGTQVIAPDGKIDLGDVLTILKKVVGVTTF